MRERQWGALKRRCTKNCLVGQEEGTITFRDEPIHAKRGRNVGSFIPGVAGVAINMVNGDVKLTFGFQNYVITFAGQANVSSSVSDTTGNTCSVLRVVEDTHPFTTRVHYSPLERALSQSCLSSPVRSHCSVAPVHTVRFDRNLSDTCSLRVIINVIVVVIVVVAVDIIVVITITNHHRHHRHQNEVEQLSEESTTSGCPIQERLRVYLNSLESPLVSTT